MPSVFALASLLIGILLLLIGYGLGILSTTQALIPVFWSWPRARRLAREGKLKSPIPVAVLLTPTVVWIAVVIGAWWAVSFISPRVGYWYVIGLVVGGAQTVRALLFTPNISKRDGWAKEFATSYGSYFRDQPEGVEQDPP